MSEDATAKIQSLMARLSAVESACAGIQRLEAAVAAMDDDFGEPQKRFVSEGGGGGELAYTSYFKLYDASTRNEAGEVTECKIGVQDGGSPSSALCGVAVLNGVRIDVDKHSEAVAGDGAAWLVLSITSTGEVAEIIVTVPFADPPDPSGVAIAYTAKLLGRFTVTDVEPIVISTINQDYLAGGEYVDFIFADCEEQAEA